MTTKILVRRTENNAEFDLKKKTLKCSSSWAHNLAMLKHGSRSILVFAMWYSTLAAGLNTGTAKIYKFILFLLNFR